MTKTVTEADISSLLIGLMETRLESRREASVMGSIISMWFLENILVGHRPEWLGLINSKLLFSELQSLVRKFPCEQLKKIGNLCKRRKRNQLTFTKF